MEMSWRVTSDVDITVSADLDEFEGLLSAIADWHFDPRVEHRVGRIAKDHHRRRVDEFLAKVGDEDNWAHTRMRAVGPWAWRHDDDALPRRLRAFGLGLESGR
jgi:hypothetical protein